jgi:hypothetical protein
LLELLCDPDELFALVIKALTDDEPPQVAPETVSNNPASIASGLSFSFHFFFQSSRVQPNSAKARSAEHFIRGIDGHDDTLNCRTRHSFLC